jgi:hypothetical protein
MSIESRLGLSSREKAIKIASAAVIVSLPVAGMLVRREVYLRRTKQQEGEQEALVKRTAELTSEDSRNSGDSGFIFRVER